MTEEEYFRKNNPDFCYGERPLSPYWDLFQDGVEFGERQSEKKIEELEKETQKVKQGCHKWFMRWREVKREELEVFSKIEKLKQQLEKMKCCGNCKYSNQESAYTIVCKVGGVDKTDYIEIDDNQVCDKWELRR